MKKINQYTYIDDKGNIIEFYACALKPEQKVQRYAFRIKDNEELTSYILAATKEHEVKKNNIFYCVLVILTLINGCDLKKISKGTDVMNLFNDFQKRFKENPEFEIIDNSKPGEPSYTAILINASTDCSGTGRTKQDARAKALEGLFAK